MSAFPFMPRIPFYRPYYNNYYLPTQTQHQKNNFVNELSSSTSYIATNTVPEDALHSTTNPNRNESQTETRSSDSYDESIFDLFGIQLHFDDILLICLIFFLYSEGVKDEMLFISLILLLLS